MLALWRKYFPALLALPSIAVVLYIAVLDQGDSGLWGTVYNKIYILLTWAVLFGIQFLWSRRWWFSLGLASVIISGLWLGAWFKYQFLGSQLVAPDLIVAALSPETLIEMGLAPTLGVIAYLGLLLISFFSETPSSTQPRYAIIGLVTSASLLLLLNIPSFYIDLQWTNQGTQTFPILVQSIWRTQLTEPAHPTKTTYCCFNRCYNF